MTIPRLCLRIMNLKFFRQTITKDLATGSLLSLWGFLLAGGEAGAQAAAAAPPRRHYPASVAYSSWVTGSGPKRQATEWDWISNSLTVMQYFFLHRKKGSGIIILLLLLET